MRRNPGDKDFEAIIKDIVANDEILDAENSAYIINMAKRYRGFKAILSISHLLHPLIFDQERYIYNLENPSWQIRLSSARSLGLIATYKAIAPEMYKHAIMPLVNILLEDPFEEVSAMAAWALGNIGDKSATEFLAVVLEDQSRGQNTHIEIAKALGKIGDKRALPLLINAIKSPNPKIRHSVAWALGQFGGGAVQALVETLHDDDYNVRLAVVKALGKIGDPSAAQHLVEVLQDGASIRCKAAEILGDMGDRSVIPFLLDAIHQSSEMRYYTTIALGKLGYQ